MKVNLAPEELEKTYKLLDTKEINMSIAELLFSVYEEDKYFKGVESPVDMFEKLLNYWGIPQDDFEEIEILEKWVKPVISPLKPNFFDNNSYFKTVKPKPTNSHGRTIEYLTFKAFQPFSLNDIEVDENDYFLERSPISYCLKDEKYLALTNNKEVWMSITPNEINTMQPYIDQVSGNVLVLGLGLGYYPFMISEKDNVKNITIIEYDKNIISLFKEHLLPFFPHKDKIHIIQSDAFEYLKNNKDHYDYLFADLWHNPEDGLPMYLKIKQFEKKMEGTFFQYWLEKSLLAMLRRCMLTIYEESLQNYSDKDYRNASNEIEKIINDLYFKTKNITINSYDDIYNLLKDESLLRLI